MRIQPLHPDPALSRREGGWERGGVLAVEEKADAHVNSQDNCFFTRKAKGPEENNFILSMFKRGGLNLHAKLAWFGIFLFFIEQSLIFVHYRSFQRHSVNLLTARSGQVRVSLVNEIHNRVTNVLCQAILSNADVFLAQVDVEGGLLQNRRFLCFFSAKDWDAAGPKHRIVKPHQLHLREIYRKESGQLGYGTHR